MRDRVQPPATEDKEEEDEDQEDEGGEPAPDGAQPKNRGGTTSLTAKRQHDILKLVASGKTGKDAAAQLKLSYDAVKRFLRAKTKAGELEKQTQAGQTGEGVAKQVAEQMFVEGVKRNALERAREVIRTGDFAVEGYKEDARLLGLSVDEFLARCVVFYKTNQPYIGQLHQERDALQSLVERLTEKLEPVPYRLACLLEMIRQGNEYDSDEIDVFLFGAR